MSRSLFRCPSYQTFACQPQVHRSKTAQPVEDSTPIRRFRLKGGGKSRHHMGGSERSTAFFGAGETVLETGIYEVLHEASHRAAHEVVMLNGDAFPECDTCAGKVRFRLVRTAPYIFQDEDFEETS